MRQKTSLSPISDLFKDSLAFLKKNFKKIIIITLLTLAPILLLQLGIEKLLSQPPSKIIAFIIFICVLMIIILTILQQITLILLIYRNNSGTALTIKKIYITSIKKYFLSYLWISALIFSIMSAGLLAMQTIDYIHSLLKLLTDSKIINFILSAIVLAAVLGMVIYLVYLAISFILGYFIMIAADIKGWKALKKSKELITGAWWDVFIRLILLNLLLMGLSLPNIFLSYLPKEISYFSMSVYYILLLAMAIPFTVIYIYNIYKDLIIGR